MCHGTELASICAMSTHTSDALLLHHDYYIYRAICERTSVGIVVYELPEGAILYANRAARRFEPGLPGEEVLKDATLDICLSECLPKAVWRRWLLQSQRVDKLQVIQHWIEKRSQPNRKEMLSAWSSARSENLERLILGIQIMPIYERVVARLTVPLNT